MNLVATLSEVKSLNMTVWLREVSDGFGNFRPQGHYLCVEKFAVANGEKFKD